MNITSVVFTAVTSWDSSPVSPSGVGGSNLIATTLASTHSTPPTFLRSTSSRVVFDISQGSSSGIATSPRSKDNTHDFFTAYSVISASSTTMDGDTVPSGVLSDQTSHVLSTTPSLTPATPSSSTSVLTMPTESPQVPSSTLPTSTAPPPLPMPVLIGIGAGGGVLLLGLVFIAIVIFCGCCGAKCRRKQQHGRRNPEAMHSEQTWMEDKNLSGNNLFPLRNGTIKENLNVSTPESVGVSNHGSMHVSSHDIPEQLNTLGGRSPFLPDMQNGSSGEGTLSPRVEAAGTTRTSDPPEPHSLSSPDTIMVQVLPVIVPKEQPVTVPMVQPVTMPTVQPMPAVQPVTIPTTQPVAMPTVQPVNLPMVHNDINTRTVEREQRNTCEYVNQQMLESQQVPTLADVPNKKKKKKPVPAPRPVTHSTSPPHVSEGYTNMAVHPEDQYDVPKHSVAKKQSSPVVSPLSPFSPTPGVSAAVTRNHDRPVTISSTTPSPRATSSEYDIPSGVLCSTKKNKIPPIIGPKPKKSEKMSMAVTESLYDTPKSTNQLVTSPPVLNSGGYYVPIKNPINVSSSTEFPPSDTYDCPRTHTLPAHDIAHGLYDTPKTAYFSTLQPMHKQDEGLYDVPKSTQFGQYIAMASTKRVPDSQLGDPNLQYDFLMPLSHKDGMAYGSHGINDSDYDVPKSFHHH